jgi:hypothetical protein
VCVSWVLGKMSYLLLQYVHLRTCVYICVRECVRMHVCINPAPAAPVAAAACCCREAAIRRLVRGADATSPGSFFSYVYVC